MRASYPEAVATSVGLGRAWLPAWAASDGSADTTDAMPDVAELTAGLDEMIT
jgi:hypothetical protein